jgi:hypothetical protein
MSVTLTQILTDSAAYLDLTATVPTDDELATRSNYADRAVRTAAAAGRMKEFTKIYDTYITAATISLPTDFREPEEALYVLEGSGGWVEFPIIESKEKYKRDVSDQFAYIEGNRADGYVLTLNNMASYTTISMAYQKYPKGLLSVGAICELADENYVTRKIEAYVLESRSDNRFTLVDADANRLLGNMVGRSNKKPAGTGNRTSKNFINPLS